MTFPFRSKKFFFGLVLFILAFSPKDISAGSDAARFFSCFSTYDKDLDYIASRYSLVIWHKHPDLVASLPLLHHKNPRIKILLYRELFCILRNETPLAESVGHYDWIMANHPEWFQKDANGDLVEVPDYPGRFMMDAGNSLWQDFWIRQTLQDVKEGQWDGVFVDDVLTSVKMHDLPRLQNYIDDESLQAAMYGFLQKIHSAFRAEGLLVIANVSNSYDYPGLFNKWLLVTDGMMEEHFSGESWTWGPQVAGSQLEAMQAARAADKWYLCLTYGSWDDTKLMDLSLGTYLLASGSKVLWAYRPDHEPRERRPVDPEWLDAIGKPLGDSQRVGALWHREFEGGDLFINPSNVSQTISHLGDQKTIEPFSLRKFIGPVKSIEE